MSKKKKNIQLELKIEKLAFEGFGIARNEELVYFVKNAIPGDTVLANVTKKRKNYAEANTLEVLEKSSDRIEPICKYFNDCGGCTLQSMNYSEQIYWKKQFVVEALQRIGKITDANIEDTLAAPQVFNYRNKMEFSFSAQRWLNIDEIAGENDILQKDFALGLHTPKNYMKVIDIDKCWIQQDTANIILNIARDLALDMGITAFHSHIHEGFLKNLVIRYSRLENEFLVILITNRPTVNAEEEFVSKLYEKVTSQVKNTSSFLWGVNSTLSPLAQGEIVFKKGKGYLTEEILGIKFQISPFSFFQTNPTQLNNFISLILEKAELKPTDFVIDLYCGAGSITLPAAKKVEKIVGFELVQSAVSDAKMNAQLNNIENAEFYVADLHAKETPDLLKQFPTPDVLLIDPPRAGMHKNLVQHIIEIKPKNIIYVSCNPATQARDMILLKEFYEIESCTPVDMFPQTYHTESVAKLILK
ncbi:MAG: 23S rRNA (uracil-5-)-methyltransferase RumA [Ignavibacteria bacterium GWF2_33_9]|nr:MAG: 23S rRNA (uracil-5-)-methyltransferase RumA [Ignavibacteria bacterium GWF2_33_9]